MAMNNNLNTSHLVEKVINYMIKKANTERKLIDFAKNATYGEMRIAQIRIIDINKKYWIGFDGAHIIKLDRNEEIKPTTIFTMDSSTFLSIILGKISPMRAVYLGLIQIDGEYWMRDLALFEDGLESFLGNGESDSSWRNWVSGGN